MSRIWRRIDHLQALRPYAPVAVRARAERELQGNRRASPAQQRELRSLADERPGLTAPHDTSCAFPVLLDPHDPRAEGIEGAVLQARCLPSSQASSLGGVPIAAVLPKDHPALPLLADELGSEPYRLHFLPAPGALGCKVVDIDGGSLGLSLLISLHAALRGRAVPPDMAASAAIERDRDGLRLAPVDGACEKARVLALERPGCRFLVCPHPGEVPEASDGIQVEVLEPGPVGPLLDRLLGTQPQLAVVEPRHRLVAMLDDARGAFGQQRYPEAEGMLEEVLRALAPPPERVSEQDLELWSFEARFRLAAIEMHQGTGAAAMAKLDALLSEGGAPLTQALLVELVVNAAGAAIDSFDPDRAAALLQRIESIEQFSMLAPADLLTPELERQLLMLRGTRARLYLLCGELDLALAEQLRAVEVSAPNELARSLTNLGECFHRCGKDTAARDAWTRARAALDQVESHYRFHTAAFLTFYEGRAALMAGAGADDALAIAEGAAVIAAQLSETAAARWRLEGLVMLGDLTAGRTSALRGLVTRVRAGRSDFLRWYRSLDLVRAGVLVEGHALEAFRDAAAVLEGIEVPGHPPLAHAQQAFCVAARTGTVTLDMVGALMRLRAY